MIFPVFSVQYTCTTSTVLLEKGGHDQFVQKTKTTVTAMAAQHDNRSNANMITPICSLGPLLRLLLVFGNHDGYTLGAPRRIRPNYTEREFVENTAAVIFCSEMWSVSTRCVTVRDHHRAGQVAIQDILQYTEQWGGWRVIPNVVTSLLIDQRFLSSKLLACCVVRNLVPLGALIEKQ
jgi:hypothetical protein